MADVGRVADGERMVVANVGRVADGAGMVMTDVGTVMTDVGTVVADAGIIVGMVVADVGTVMTDVGTIVGMVELGGTIELDGIIIVVGGDASVTISPWSLTRGTTTGMASNCSSVSSGFTEGSFLISFPRDPTYNLRFSSFRRQSKYTSRLVPATIKKGFSLS